MPRDTDKHIGRRLREARLARGLSQGALGKKLGVTFQQVQKYESGANRIGGSRLWDISGILEVPVGHFFEGLPAAGSAASTREPEAPLTRRSLELAKEIDAIPDETIKMQVLRLVRAITKGDSA
ncbi:MAG: helix-turn-helix domain-containing protein [Rhodospirillales bacterium]|nr:helix-turn-helix domain-containing protein [Rhodospirillales bacterium]MDH3790811.1 helix-turn-helix domain-containing protein [Rhodospirillales bacterium]MDH3912055.1 helix-turn-helix domain-containing protein [Rhodospirillales bacterium]MDH3917928.1 helix-turn-helix domain-containing protein [Rhodospirillales bacterium]MDH3968812.1 helix-turn-helix domain-containing protein [Rhodospirillales bacterium]